MKVEWDGVIMEQNASAKVLECSFSNASICIKSWEGSYLSLKDNKFENFHTGLSFSGNIQLLEFDRNIFENGSTLGVHGFDTDALILLRASSDTEFNTFQQIPTGILLENATGIISHNHFKSVPHAIHLDKSNRAEVSQNFIWLEHMGVEARNSSSGKIIDNTIGIDNSVRGTGIFSQNVNFWQISDNEINTNNVGIFSMNSLAQVIHDNEITITGDLSNVTGGIQISSVHRSAIHNNIINVTGALFGIETESSLGNHIYENNLSVGGLSWKPTSAGIRVMGNGGQNFENNTISVGGPYGTGITARNTNRSIFQCNTVSAGTALSIGQNAPMHDIRDNYLAGSSTDLSIESEIGIQYHHGNQFIVGTAKADGLDIDEINKSLFYVNEGITYHMPTNPIPDDDEWFRNENETPYSCPDPSEKVPDIFYADAVAICEFWERVKEIKAEYPGAFVELSLQLITGIRLRDSIAIPACISSDTAFTNTCGLVTLDAVNSGYHIMIRSGSEFRTAMDLILEDINMWKDSIFTVVTADSAQLVGYLSNIRPMINDLYSLTDSIHLEKTDIALELLDSLQSITCGDSIMSAAKDILTYNVEYYLGNEPNSTVQEELRSYSDLCAEVWGSIIYRARSLTATFDTLTYEDNDLCIESERTTSASPEALNDLEVAFGLYPNPAGHVLNITMPDYLETELLIYDMSGKQVKNIRLSSLQQSLNNDLSSGLFMALFVRNGEIKKAIRFVVNK